MIEIEKGIPIPNDGRGRPSRYPWTTMDVGDSFFIPGKTAHDFSGIASGAGFRTGRKFTTRTVEGGVRVWRIE